MKYPRDLYQQVDAILSQRRQETATCLQQRRDIIHENYPDVHHKQQELAALGAQLGKMLLDCSPQQREKHLADYQAKGQLFPAVLEAAGLAPDYLNEQPACTLCHDKGFVYNGSLVKTVFLENIMNEHNNLIRANIKHAV